MNLAERVSLSLAECAAATGLSEREVREAYRSGELPARFRGKRVLVLRTDLEAWITGLPTERAS